MDVAAARAQHREDPDRRILGKVDLRQVHIHPRDGGGNRNVQQFHNGYLRLQLVQLLEQAGIRRGKFLPDGRVLGRPVLLLGVVRFGKSRQRRLQLGVVAVEILH